MGTTAASSFSVQANLITFNVSLTAITCIVRGPQIENTIEDGTPASVKNFVTALISLFPYVDFESVLMTRLRKNFGNSPQFLVVNLTINETTSNTNFTWLGLPSITTKEDTPLDLLGRERPGFEIRPIRYRLWNRMDWIEDGTDGGLLATGPTALAVGDPACTNGTLSIVSRAYFNGAADFLITMEGVVSHALSIVVLPVNLPPTFQARQWANMSENSSATFPGFFYSVFAGYDQKAGVGVVYEGANQSQTVNLSIAYLGYGPYVWTQNSQMISGSASVVPSLLLVSTAAGSAATLVDLHVQVRDFVYGTFFFSAHATDSLGAVSNASNFTIRVRPVDGRPLILSNTTFKLAEDQYAVSPLVQNALANPFSLMWVEEVLNSTYTVTPLGPGVPSSSISILPNGTLLLSTLKYHNGNTTWSVQRKTQLYLSAVARVVVYVYYVNRQPSFVPLACDPANFSATVPYYSFLFPVVSRASASPQDLDCSVLQSANPQECAQTFSFTVVAKAPGSCTSGQDCLFSHPPYLVEADGLYWLNFTVVGQRPSVVAPLLNLTIADNGGPDNGGVGGARKPESETRSKR